MPRRIVMLNAYNSSEPLSTISSAAAQKRLLDRSPTLIGIDVDYLDLFRASDPDHEARTAAFLRKYATAPPDVIMTFGSAALPFIIKHRDAIAPKVPIVYTSISPRHFTTLELPADVTGVALDMELERTLTLAETLQPDARRLVVVVGNSSIERVWQDIARRTVESRKDKYEVTYLFGMPFSAVTNELARLPSNAIVLMTSFLVDSAGQTFVPNTAAVTFSAVSPAPIYTPYIGQIGKGIVGGFSETFEGAGEVAADIALEILAGKAPAAIPPRTNPDRAYRVDLKAMQRHGLDESRLPPGTVIMFREPSLWERHRGAVLAASSIIALLMALVIALLVQHYRRREAEISLKESEERMSFTVASVNAGLWQYDPDMQELWTTPHSASLFGLSGDAPHTWDTFIAAVHPDDRPLAIDSVRASDRTSMVNDVRVILPDGKLRWIRIRTQSHGETGATSRLTGLFIDITEQKAAEAEANQQRQEVAHLMRVSVLGELSGAIAHEINQPLTAISTNAHAALDMVPQNAPEFQELRETLQDIIQEDTRAGEVIGRLRKLLKKGAKVSESVNVNELINSTVGLLRNELINRRIGIKTNLAAVPSTVGDPVQLQQVLLNLLMNAMDAMAGTPASDRLITVSTRLAQSREIEVTVQDSGVGVDSANKDCVFQPFYTTKNHGLGLGLTICSTIVQAHGGVLKLINGDRVGAVAVFSLPIQETLVAAK